MYIGKSKRFWIEWFPTNPWPEIHRNRDNLEIWFFFWYIVLPWPRKA